MAVILNITGIVCIMIVGIIVIWVFVGFQCNYSCHIYYLQEYAVVEETFSKEVGVCNDWLLMTITMQVRGVEKPN